MPKRCCQCEDDAPAWININHVGPMCRTCYDIWWEDEVMPDLRAAQAAFHRRNYDQSVSKLSKGESRKITDVHLPEPPHGHQVTPRPEPDLRRPPAQVGPLH